MKQISSASNDLFKLWRTLGTSAGIRETGQFFLMGEKLVREYLSRGGPVMAEILNPELTPLTAAPAYQFPAQLFRELDVVGTHFNLLLLNLPAPEDADLSRPPEGMELICPLGDPGNLGALVRSARAFDIKHIWLTAEACLPFHPKAVKASAGAVMDVRFSRVGPLASLAAAPGTFALDSVGVDLAKFVWPKNARLIVGEEGPGLPKLPGISRLSVQTSGVESLNASVAASIAFYDYRLKMGNP